MENNGGEEVCWDYKWQYLPNNLHLNGHLQVHLQLFLRAGAGASWTIMEMEVYPDEASMIALPQRMQFDPVWVW